MSRRSSRTTTSAATARLLVYEVRISNGSKALFVPIGQHAPQFAPSRGHAARNDQRGISEIDEPDFTTLVDPPTMPQLCGEAGLPSMRHLCVAGRSHICIVRRQMYKATMRVRAGAGWR